MKYIRSYNESAISVLQMRNTCKDILISLVDDYIPVEAFGHHAEMQVHLGDDRVSHGRPIPTSDMIRIDTKKYKDELLRLIEYMESEGFDFIQFDYYDIFFKRMQPFKHYHIDEDEKTIHIENITYHLFDLSPTVYIKMYFKYHHKKRLGLT